MLETEKIGRKGCVSEKFPVTPSGIEHVTFGIVAQYLNELRHRVPPEKSYILLLSRLYLSPFSSASARTSTGYIFVWPFWSLVLETY